MTKYFLRAAAGVVLLTLPISVVAQVVNAECGLRGADTTIAGGVLTKQCLDPASLNGKSVQIPANVTRIDNTGFALCGSALQEGGLADIVYVLDQSGSMQVGAAWISPDKTDTIYLQNTNCTGINRGDFGGTYGNLTIPNETGVRTIPIINPAKSVAGCPDNTAGDPFTQRGIAFKEAIQFQAERAPNSMAGYMGFSGGVLDPVRPVTLNSDANINRLLNNIILHLNSGTNYTAPLDSAKRWLLSPTITTPTHSKAIIFLSDGRPSPSDQNGLKVIDSLYAAQPGKMPPVYGILLSKPSSDTAILDSISKRTGGKFFLIPPSHPDSLKSVVARILNVILRQYHPVGAVVTNGSTAPASVGTAGAADFTPQGNNEWLFNFDKIIPLNKQADNQIKLSTEYLDQTGAAKDTTVNFILSTKGPEESANKNLPGTQFSVVCIDLPPPPPPVDPIKVAYLKDINGDGAGDLLVIVFLQPLTALPASLDAYWNDFGPAFKNKTAPVLTFLPGSGNKVILADFSASPWPVGVTSIPAGAAPVVVLPTGGVFGGQSHAIDDSIGPILLSGTVKPFDASKLQPGLEENIDTITVIASEPIRTKGQWTTVLLWSKSVGGKCEDFVNAQTVVVSQSPSIDGSNTKLTVLADAANPKGSPTKGDCVYLNVDGTYTDMDFNLPPVHGVVLDGTPPPRKIDLFRGYPPVVGLDATNPGFMVTNQDPRTGSSTTSYSVLDSTTGKYTVSWIPPVGFVEGSPFTPAIPALTSPSVGVEGTGVTTLPPGISTIQVVSTGKYIADITIYDNRGTFLKRFKQPFGYNGELNNRFRIAPKGEVSYLVWDLKDDHGRKAGQGVYIWKVLFTFDSGKQEVQYTRTGVMRRLGWQAP